MTDVTVNAAPGVNDAALNPTPALRDVVREQLFATALGLRREALVGVALALAVTVIVFISLARTGPAGHVSLSPDGAGFFLGFIGLLAPLAVWKREGPSNRGYLWSLPVERQRHHLVKVFAGWAWLMAGIAALLAWVGLQVLVTGGAPGVNEMRYVLADPAAAGAIRDGIVDPAALVRVHWTTPAWQWVIPFVAPTVMYLLGSIAALLVDHPWRWIAAPFLLFVALQMVAEAAGLGWLARSLDAMVEGTYSIETLFTGSNEMAVGARLTTGEPVMVHVWFNLAEARQWFTTAAIWFVPAFAGVLLAARRYQER
jgi:hypothetical protein